MKSFLFLCLTIILLAGPGALAQSKLDLQANDTVQSLLARQLGKPVELRLKSGEKIAGKLQKVTEKFAHLAQLTDADYYDAAVELESVVAVVVRVRSN